ncbi:MAG: osmoprotectant NAGGN system M42 family peptidase [Gemmatimonadales bacterium]|jgi:peptidase M42 family hydrolase
MATTQLDDAAPQRPAVDLDYILDTIRSLLDIPSPSGYTDQVVHWVGEELQRLGVPFELTRRGAIRADVAGRSSSPDRALVVHLDTIGAMVQRIKPDGRLALVPIGTWSARFAAGGRVTLMTDTGCRRGTVLPLKASGHTFGDEVDSQPGTWDQLELRLDDPVESVRDVEELGVNVGDFIAFDPGTEFIEDTGFINARHLDDKAGVAVLLGAVKAVRETGAELPVDCHLIFTISEEVGSGSSHTLHGDVAEMVTVDSAPHAHWKNSREDAVTIAMMDSAGPFDWHLTHKLIDICRDYDIPHRRDVFQYYRSDSASAVDAGNDLRTALVCFGVDSSHGWERTNTESLQALAELIVLYMMSEPTFVRDRDELAELEGFSRQPMGPAENPE